MRVGVNALVYYLLLCVLVFSIGVCIHVQVCLCVCSRCVSACVGAGAVVSIIVHPEVSGCLNGRL